MGELEAEQLIDRLDPSAENPEAAADFRWLPQGRNIGEGWPPALGAADTGPVVNRRVVAVSRRAGGADRVKVKLARDSFGERIRNLSVLVPWRAVLDDPACPRDLAITVFDGNAVFDGNVPVPSGISDVELFVLPYGFFPGGELYAQMPALRVVQTLTAGVEKVVDSLPHGVTLCNGRGLHDASVAEHALALMLTAQRDFPRWFGQQQAGVWLGASTRSLADSRVTIIGYGSIGRAIERRVVACEATVKRVASRARPSDDVYGLSDLPSLLPTTDILVLTLPETPDTVDLIGERELAALPTGALVVNVGRGRTLASVALQKEVACGRLRAALDVFDPEPLPCDSAIWGAPGVIVTPHIGGGSACFFPRARRFIVEQLARFAAGEPLLNVVARQGRSGGWAIR